MSGKERIARFVDGLRAAGVELAVISYPVDVYYLAGTAQPSTLIISVDAGAILLVNRNLDVALRESWVDDIRESPSFKELRGALVGSGHGEGVIGFCGDVMPANNYVRIREALPKARLVDISAILRRTRMIKDEHEIRMIREAARISDVGLQAARTHIRPGVSEIEVSTAIELDMVRAGADNVVLSRSLALFARAAGAVSAINAFPSCGMAVPVGGRGSTPVVPYGPSKYTVRNGDVVVIDLCGTYEGYLADASRTYVLGKPSHEQTRLAQALKDIVEKGLQLLKPGTRASEVFEAVGMLATDAGYGEYYMGPGERKVRFCGHGVGMQVDELPVIFPGDGTVLAEGMVLAFEPTLLIPNVAIAAMENTILITASAHERLTTTPLDMVELT